MARGVGVAGPGAVLVGAAPFVLLGLADVPRAISDDLVGTLIWAALVLVTAGLGALLSRWVFPSASRRWMVAGAATLCGFSISLGLVWLRRDPTWGLEIFPAMSAHALAFPPALLLFRALGGKRDLPPTA